MYINCREGTCILKKTKINSTCYFVGLKIYFCFCCLIIACDSNFYGENCSLPCGHCLDSKQCHHINGTCLNGCDGGHQGLNCMEGSVRIALDV